jgi:serine/threonine protein kinase
MREVNSIRARRHANIVKLHASFIARREDPWELDDKTECLYLLCEYADGGNLEEWLAKTSTPPDLIEEAKRGEEIMRCIQDLVAAVSHIHSEIKHYSAYHHDIKPGNIVIFKGSPPVWKLCDFGMANLKHRDDESGTNSRPDSSFGTYNYWPPEYAKEKLHGRPFDVYSLGCVLLELATIWKYGWEGEQLDKFRELRGQGTDQGHGAPDYSYHNNTAVVQEWIRRLRQGEREDTRLKMLLDLIDEMMASRADRVFIWEVQMDLYEMSGKRTPGQLKKYFRDIVQPSKTSLNGLDNKHNPLRRAFAKGKSWQIEILEQHKWSMVTPEINGESLTGKGYHRSNLDDCAQNYEFSSHKLLGRHELDWQISELMPKAKWVGLYGKSGSG